MNDTRAGIAKHLQEKASDQPSDASSDPAQWSEDARIEDGVALAFAAQHADELRYDHDAGRWYVWNGSCWRRDEKRLAFAWCRRAARRIASAANKPSVRATMGRAAFAAGVERLAQSDESLAVTSADWDRDPFQLGVPGGIVDLRTGKIGPPDPKAMITKQTAVAPAAEADEATCPRWLKFIDEATCGDEKLAGFLQRWAGYFLTGLTVEHAFLFAYGPTGSGKGTFVRAISGVLGDYAIEAAPDTFTSTRNEQHTTYLAMLKGKRLVTTSETEEGRSWKEALLKQITGGDKLTARFMHKDNFEFTPQCKILVTGNHKPTLRRADDAMRRRLNLAPFDNRPAEVDLALDEKLGAEWPGILRWMINGERARQASGLNPPASVKLATDKYFANQDVFGQWLAEACDVERGNSHKSEQSSRLYASWSSFAKARGIDPGSSVRFADMMEEQGFEHHKGSAANSWRGIMLRGADPYWRD